MTVLKAKTNPAGPGTIDIQIEQGADFYLSLGLKRGGITWDLTGATFSARMNRQWSPGETRLDFTVEAPTPTNGLVVISIPAAVTAALTLPNQPQKMPDGPKGYAYGGWIFEVTQDGVTQRVVEGTVTLDRDPCLS